MGVFVDGSGVCVYSSTLRRGLVCHHSSSLSSFHQPPFSLLPPVSFFSQLPTRSVSVQLSFPDCFISLSVSPPPICFLFFAVSTHAVVFFFLRSHFRTSEGDQEEIGLREPAVKGSSAPFALQISAQRSENIQSKLVSA